MGSWPLGSSWIGIPKRELKARLLSTFVTVVYFRIPKRELKAWLGSTVLLYRCRNPEKGVESHRLVLVYACSLGIPKRELKVGYLF